MESNLGIYMDIFATSVKGLALAEYDLKRNPDSDHWRASVARWQKLVDDARESLNDAHKRAVDQNR